MLRVVAPYPQQDFGEPLVLWHLSWTTSTGPRDEGLTEFLTEPGAILISTDVADRYGLDRGARITLDIAGYQRSAFIAGLLQPAG